MKNFKKLSAAVLAVALVLTSMTTVFAADPATPANAEKAATLKDLGLYAGTDATDVAAGLDGALTTQDSLIFLAKLFGYNEAANALTADQVAEALAKFDDAASISDYAKNVVAYSATNSILSGSTDGNRFFVGAKDTVTAARFATFMLKQMGYTVADYKASVAKLAEAAGSKVDATLTGDLTRDAAVGVMFGALTAEKASGKTVIADIVGDNADLKAKAEKLGLIAPPPIDLAVESVKALNCKQIQVVFNQEMDRNSVESEGFYEIQDKGSNIVELGDSSASLGDDKRTVIIILNKNVANKLTNSSEAKVTINKDIKAKSGVKLAKAAVFEKVTVEDGIIPTVTKAEATGERNIRITFSEPVYDKGNDNSIAKTNFKVVSGTYEYLVQEATLDNNVINLEIGTKLIEGPVTVTVNNAGADKTDAIVDYAGYAVFKSSTTFNYVKDTSVSVVTVKEAKPESVTLAFTKPVKFANLKLYHSVKNAAAYECVATTASKYKDEFKFEFKPESKLQQGTVKLFLVNADNDADKMVDGYGIKVPDQTLTCEIVVDETEPVFTKGDFDKNTSIFLTFDEELDKEEAEKTENYTIKKYSDPFASIAFKAIYNDNAAKKENTVTLKPEKLLEDNTEYVVTIKKAMDTYGNKTVKEYTYTFTTGDNTAPDVKDAVYADAKNDASQNQCYTVNAEGKIYITFTESMNEAQMLDLNNYMVNIGDGFKALDKDKDKVTKVSDRKICIEVGAFADEIKPSVKVAPIMDLAGKRLRGSVDSVVISNIIAQKDPVPSVTAKVKSVYGNVVVLGFLWPVKGSNIKLYFSDKNNEAYKAEATVTDYTNEIKFMFNSSLPFGELKLFLVNSKTEGEELIDRYGVFVPDQSLTCNVEAPPPEPVPAHQTPTDTTVPVVDQCIVNKNESIKIIFNEKIDIETATTTGSYIVKKLSDGEVIPLSASIDDSMKSVELKFGSDLEDYTEYQLLIKEYKDIYGNQNTSDYTYNFTTSEYIHPYVINDPENDQDCCTIPEKGRIIIVYSEAMNEAQMLNKENYQVSLDEGENYKELGDNDTITGINDRTVQIYFEEFKGKNINPYVMIAPIVDLAGNKLYDDSDAHYIVENIEPENVQIEQAQLIAKDKIKVVFNKKMGNINISDFLIDSTTPGAISVVDCEPASENSDGKTEVVLVLNKELTTDAKDEAGNQISFTTVDTPSTESEWGGKLRSYYCFPDDRIAPEVINDPEKDQYCYSIPEKGEIIIVYSEAMNEVQMLNKGNYQVSINEGETYVEPGDDDKINRVDDRTVTIYIKELENKSDPTIIPYVKIAPIMDIAGNKLYDNDEPYIIEPEVNYTPDNGVYIKEAAVYSTGEIILYFNEEMEIFNGKDIIFSNLTNTTTPCSIVEWYLTDRKEIAKLWLDCNLPDDAKNENGDIINITTIDNPTSVSQSGNKLKSNFSIKLEDKVAPRIIEVIGSKAQGQNFIDTITIYFSEAIDGNRLSHFDEFNQCTRYPFDVYGYSIKNIEAFDETKTVVLTVEPCDDGVITETTVEQTGEIYDKVGNLLEPSYVKWVVTLENPQTN